MPITSPEACQCRCGYVIGRVKGNCEGELGVTPPQFSRRFCANGGGAVGDFRLETSTRGLHGSTTPAKRYHATLDRLLDQRAIDTAVTRIGENGWIDCVEIGRVCRRKQRIPGVYFQSAHSRNRVTIQRRP